MRLLKPLVLKNQAEEMMVLISKLTGSPVRAAKSGKVIYRGNELPAWGNLSFNKA